MKRSQFKAIVKECLVEILRDNMEMFQEAAPRGRATKKARAQAQQKVKRSLRNLVQEQAPRQPPQYQQYAQQQYAQQQPPPRRSGPPTVQEMILSAASTLNQQNAMGEMSSRAIGYEAPQQPQMPVDEGYQSYSAYGNTPMPHDPRVGGMGGGMMPPQQMPPQALPQDPPIPGGADADGDSHWAQLAFFDQ